MEETVEMARERYRLARASTGEPFAVPLEGPNVARLLRGGNNSLRAELAATYVERCNTAPFCAISSPPSPTKST